MDNRKSKRIRRRLVNAAADAFRQVGYGQTSLATVAGKAGVPVGNVYYYFKAKQDLVDSVLDRLADELDTSMRDAELKERPIDRVLYFLEVSRSFAEDRAKFGCPAARLFQDAKSPSDAVHKIMERPINWLASQFEGAGFSPTIAREHAVYCAALVQGSYVLGNMYGDASLIQKLIDRLINDICHWR